MVGWPGALVQAPLASNTPLTGRVASHGPSLTALESKGQSTELLPVPDTSQGPGSSLSSPAIWFYLVNNDHTHTHTHTHHLCPYQAPGQRVHKSAPGGVYTWERGRKDGKVTQPVGLKMPKRGTWLANLVEAEPWTQGKKEKSLPICGRETWALSLFVNRSVAECVCVCN